MIIELAAKPNSKWIARWEAPSNSNPDLSYTVAVTIADEWGCTCPHWIYRRKLCKHIKAVVAHIRNPDLPTTILEGEYITEAGFETISIKKFATSRFELLEV